MRKLLIVVGAALCIACSSAGAAEKSEVLSRIDGARAAVESFAAKAKNNGSVVADVEAARSYVRKAGQAFEEGKQMFGLGALKPEAEQDIVHSLAMADLNIALAESRLLKGKATEELAVINAQLDKVKTKVKVFEDRKAAMEKLRADAAKYEAAAKELSTLKAEKALLASQVEMLMAERKQFEKLKEEKAELIRQLENLKGADIKPAELLEKPVPQPVRKPVAAAAAEAAAAPPVPAAKAPETSAQEAPATLQELVAPEEGKAPLPAETPAGATAPPEDGPK